MQSDTNSFATTDNEPIDDGPVQWMAELLGSWLNCEKWTPEQLIDWLQGYDLPAVGHDEDPYVWLLRGLPLGEDRNRMEVRFAERVAHVLEDAPDVKRPGKRPDEVLYNLFMLCAGLSCPEQLGEPLWRIYERQSARREKRLDTEVRGALRAALVENQLDNRLQDLWERMVNGQKDEFLRGNQYDAFEGILPMPPTADMRGNPCLNAIGCGLEAMARYLERERDRRIAYRNLLGRVVQTYPGRPTWDADLIQLADEYRLPGWAIECLPSLCVCLKRSEGQDTFYLWHFILACIPESFDYHVLVKRCFGQVVEAQIPPNTAEFVESVAPLFEQRRLSNPFPSERSTIGVALDAMATLESAAVRRRDPKIARVFADARRKILPDLKAIAESTKKLAETLEGEVMAREEMFLLRIGLLPEIYGEQKTWRTEFKQVAHELHLPNWAEKCMDAAPAFI